MKQENLAKWRVKRFKKTRWLAELLGSRLMLPLPTTTQLNGVQCWITCPDYEHTSPLVSDVTSHLASIPRQSNKHIRS